MRHYNETDNGLTTKHVDPAILSDINYAIIDIGYGSITLVVQDARLIQMEMLKKVRFSGVAPKVANSRQAEPNALRDSINEQITAALTGMKFGQVTLKISQGRIVQVERMEKQRFPSLEGTYGDGI